MGEDASFYERRNAMPSCTCDVVLLYDDQVPDRDDNGHLNQRGVTLMG